MLRCAILVIDIRGKSLIILLLARLNLSVNTNPEVIDNR
jgi:hypothetical protein